MNEEEKPTNGRINGIVLFWDRHYGFISDLKNNGKDKTKNYYFNRENIPTDYHPEKGHKVTFKEGDTKYGKKQAVFVLPGEIKLE